MPYGTSRKTRSLRPGRLAAGAAAAFFIAAFAAPPPADAATVKTSHDVPGAGVSEEYVPGEIVVWFADAASAAQIDAVVARAGGDVVARSAVTPSRLVISVPGGEEDSYAPR